MRLRSIVAAGAALAGAACGGGGPAGAGGRLHLERVTGSRTVTLLDQPGLATYCPADSLLTIIATGRTASAGFAVHAAVPWPGTRTYPVGASLVAPGTATAAFRLPSGVARLGIGGSVRLSAAGRVDGDFDVQVSDSAGVATRVRGRITAIPVTRWPPPTCGGT